MNKLYILPVLLVFISFSCQAQNQIDCNRAVRSDFYSKKIPEDICLTPGYEFSYLYDYADVNDDGLKDFITEWRKQDIQDGDTLYLSIYEQVDSAKYELAWTFDNLYPIYFQRYELSYVVEDSLLNELQGRYGGKNPLNILEFKKGEILIHLQPGVVDHYFLQYRYDPKAKNWYLEKRIYSEEDYEGNLQERTNEYLWDQKISIDKFDYFDYL
jgi:hypothetical protein